jgi:hypothetical protein
MGFLQCGETVRDSGLEDLGGKLHRAHLPLLGTCLRGEVRQATLRGIAHWDFGVMDLLGIGRSADAAAFAWNQAGAERFDNGSKACRPEGAGTDVGNLCNHLCA